jgi:hypothetical protein
MVKKDVETQVSGLIPLLIEHKKHNKGMLTVFFLELRRRVLCHFTTRGKRVKEQGENSPPKNATQTWLSTRHMLLTKEHDQGDHTANQKSHQVLHSSSTLCRRF